MNDYEKTIKDLQDRVKSLEDRLTPCNGAVAEPKKWSPVGGDWRICSSGNVDDWNSNERIKNFGHERSTEKQAERALIEMRRFNRLLALRDELCGDVDNAILTARVCKYYIYYNYQTERYEYRSNNIVQAMGTIYFTTEETTRRAVAMLNCEEVEL